MNRMLVPPMESKDDQHTRTEYFRQCLHWLLRHLCTKHSGQRVTIGVPVRGWLAGDNWNIYLGMIEYFTEKLKATHHQDDSVTIYCLPMLTKGTTKNDVTLNRDVRKIYVLKRKASKLTKVKQTGNKN